MWDKVTFGVLAVGITLRAEAVVDQWSAPVHGDVSGFLSIARQVSWLEPWATEHREPLWILLVKVLTGPFDYSHRPLVVWALLASIGTLVLASGFLRRQFAPRAALAGIILISIHPLVKLDAVAGLRESTATLLIAGAALAAADGRWVSLAVASALLVGVRWELGVLAVAVLLLASIVTALRARVPAVAALLALVWMTPFMVTNGLRHGDPMYHSNTHAGWYQAMETRGWGGGPSQRPGTSWASYYLDFVGPTEALERAATGAVRIPGSLVMGTLDHEVSHDPVAGDLERSAWATAMGAILVLLLIQQSAEHPVGRWAALSFVGGLMGYAALDWVMPYRLVSFLVLPLAVMVTVVLERRFEFAGKGPGAEHANSSSAN